MTNRTARITRSTSRLLKEHNMIKEDGIMINVNEEKVKSELHNLDEEPNEDKPKESNDDKPNESNENKQKVSNEDKPKVSIDVKPKESNEDKPKVSNEDKPKVSNEDKPMVSNDDNQQVDALEKVENTNVLPELRVGLKRSATLKSTPRPTVDIKRNKTNEFATPQSIKKLSRPLNFGSASKKLTKLPTATVTKLVNKPTTATLTMNGQIISKLKKPEDLHTHHLEIPSQTTNNNRYLVPPSSTSSISSQSSAASLKSCPTSAQQTIKIVPRLNPNNANSEGKQRCFGESALKQRLEEEKRRKLLEQKIAKEAEAKLKKDKFLQQRALETKSKREERERKVREGKLQQDAEAEQRRIAELKKQEEHRKQIELEKQAEEAKKLAELKRQAEEAKRLEEIKRQEEIRKQYELEREEKRRLEELKQQKTPQSAKKVEFSQEYNEDLQTKCFEKLEKKIIEDQMKCKNTPMKQLVVEAVGKTNAEKSLYKPEIDPSLDVIELSMSSSDSSISIDESDFKETTSNCTFIKDIQNKALSSTFIKPQTAAVSSIPPVQQPVTTNNALNNKPSTPVFDSYDISDLCSDEEDDEEEQRAVNKRIPQWTKGQEFLRAIKEQFSKRSRERENIIGQLFLSIESEIQLHEVFHGSQKFVSKKYERRTSSACWNSPPAVHIDHSFSRFY